MLRNTKLNLQRTLKYVLGGIASTLALLHIAAVTIDANVHNALSGDILHVFDLDSERNVPTVYSGLLLGCSAFIALILMTQKNELLEKLRWAALSLFFFYLAFDEMLSIHETFAEPIRKFLDIADGSFLYHAWIIPGLVLAILIAICALIIKSKNRISRLQKTIFFYVAVLAVGVIILEMLGTQIYFSTTVYKLIPVTLEEMFEIFVSSLILYKLTIAAFNLPSK